MYTTEECEFSLLKLLHSTKNVEGLTHNYYRYPARMLPELAREIITLFTDIGETVLDPFMGGGTSIVEAIALGRKAIGFDINPLAVFITDVKITPLSLRDEYIIKHWVKELEFKNKPINTFVKGERETIKNLPDYICNVFNSLLRDVALLPFPRQRRFARCSLLRLGQWAIDGKESIPEIRALQDKLFFFIEEMLNGMRGFVQEASSHGIAKRNITNARLLLSRSAAGAHEDKKLKLNMKKPSLVITSPPYPNVHVLYHRWQVSGRRETSAPYWLIGENDGHGASYYTLGSRSKLGQQNYFREITEVFKSVRYITSPNAPVVQLVSFYDTVNQLPLYLKAMELAGYEEFFPPNTNRIDLWRTIPNRKWYNRINSPHGPGIELLLFHKPC